MRTVSTYATAVVLGLVFLMASPRPANAGAGRRTDIATVVTSMPAWAETSSDGERTCRKVKAFFDGHSDETIDAFLMRLRPAPLDEPTRAKILATLPKKGEVRPSPKDGEKLSAAQRILDYSAPRGTISIRIIDIDSAYVGLYYRTAVLVSARALALLSADEVAAVVAHEMGHDADWNPYLTAAQQQHVERLRELELKADGIGILILERLGVDPERLVSAILKVKRYNARLSTSDRYVPLADRLAFIRAVATLKWADSPQMVRPDPLSEPEQRP